MAREGEVWVALRECTHGASTAAAADAAAQYRNFASTDIVACGLWLTIPQPHARRHHSPPLPAPETGLIAVTFRSAPACLGGTALPPSPSRASGRWQVAATDDVVAGLR